MNFRMLIVAALTLWTPMGSFAMAQNLDTLPAPTGLEDTALDELDPRDPNIDSILDQMDREYSERTGQSPFLPDFSDSVPQFYGGCYRLSCEVYIRIIKSEQRAYLYIHGRPEAEWLVSTGRAGYTTPDFDRHPNGRIYERYDSKAYPGGDYMGMGNMPYAVFIQGGYAIHGTGQSNWPYLGQRASHGCIRLHPDNAKIFNRLVRANGIANTWITVE